MNAARGLRQAQPERVLAQPERVLAQPERVLAQPERGLAQPERGLEMVPPQHPLRLISARPELVEGSKPARQGPPH